MTSKTSENRFWTPAPIPSHPLAERASDPRLAAALAARERWHGRSGRPALKSPTQAVAFARERRLVHPVDASALPNLLDPIVGKACSDEERREGTAVKTLEGWMQEIQGTPDLLETRLAFDRPTLVQADLWPCLKAIGKVRDVEARRDKRLPLEVREAMEILDRRGAVSLQRLGQMLDLEPEELEPFCALLERTLLVVSRVEFDEDEEKEQKIVEPLLQWLERTPHQEREMDVQRAWTLLFIGALRSSVALWPEELRALFPWTAAERAKAIEEAKGTGTVISYVEEGHRVLVASPVPR